MIVNGEISVTPETLLYKVPEATPGLNRSGNNAAVNLFRIVNTSGAQRTFNLYLNVNGVAINIIPVNTILPIGACFDDLPEFQLPPGGKILGDASGASVVWTINVILLSA